MIDRITKNAEIFRDTEKRYKSDAQLMGAVRESTAKQVFIGENESVSVPAPNKSEKAHIVVSGKRSLVQRQNFVSVRATQ